MKILCKSPAAPGACMGVVTNDGGAKGCVQLKDTPAEGYEPMAGGKWYVLVTEISQRWAPAE